MNIPRAARAAAVLAATATLSSAGLAAARPGDRSLPQTFPRASALCQEAASGHLPRSLMGETAQVTAACTALDNAYGAAVTTAQSALMTYQTAVDNARNARTQGCAGTGRAGRIACRQARDQARLTIAAARNTLRGATIAYRMGIESARATFWGTIHGLRGGAGIPADAPVPNAAIPTT